MKNNFSFNEEVDSIKARPKKPVSGFARLVMKMGIAKTESQANVVLMLFIIVGMTLIVYINWKTFF